MYTGTRRVAAIVLRHYYLMRGNFARMMSLFVWVAVDIILWGFITRFLNTVTAGEYDFVPVLLGAVLLWDFFTRVMQGVTMAFFEDVWTRNFLNIFATPLSVAEYVAGLVLSSIATSTVGLVVMLILATMIFSLSFFTLGLVLVPFLLSLFLFGIALGIIGSAIVLRFGPVSEWFIWPIPAIIAPFAGVFYPVATLPSWMQFIAHLLPPSWVFEGMRKVLSGETVPVDTLAWSFGLNVIYIIGACWFFMRVYHYAVHTGLFARYSAESVT